MYLDFKKNLHLNKPKDERNKFISNDKIVHASIILEIINKEKNNIIRFMII